MHGDCARLTALHDALYERFRPGDRIVYLGNYTGYGPRSAETVDELLAFRRQILSIPGIKVDDLVYLRGGQEEIWQKLLQLPFAPDPADTLLWMLGHGLSATLESYGLSPHDAFIAAREGIMPLTRWIAKARETTRGRAGHDLFQTHQRRAAFTAQDSGSSLLFVHAGINPARDLHDQGDALLWGGKMFSNIVIPYAPFHKVVRGFDPTHGGLHLNCVTATIDGGCGFGGSLACAGFDAQGGIFEVLEA
ncbi:MAG: hypothetical protein KDJ15_05325 [Alphaproteobacteria bacterium]|nr:hypothetical protein [Alphaproteobacteria bacterium]